MLIQHFAALRKALAGCRFRKKQAIAARVVRAAVSQRWRAAVMRMTRVQPAKRKQSNEWHWH